MKINRLFEIVYLLMDKKSLTAKDLAARFEVSSRTILRDIEILSGAGIPIYTTQGKGGGISIMDHFVLDKTTVSKDEQNQILFALQSLSATEYIEIDTILSKLRALFHKTDSDWIEVDFSRWGNQQRDQTQFELLRQAIINNQAVSFSYASSYGNITNRIVYPLKLIFKAKAWYLQSYCQTKQDYRLFRINRIFDLQICENFFSRHLFTPPPIEPPAASSEALTRIVMKFSSNVTYRIYDEFNADEIIKNADGSYLISVDWPDDEWLYGYLLSFGASVQIISPQSVQNNLLQKVEGIKKIYAKHKT